MPLFESCAFSQERKYKMIFFILISSFAFKRYNHYEKNNKNEKHCKTHQKTLLSS